MTAPRLSVTPAPLRVVKNGLVALQASCIAAGELTVARAIGAIVDDLEQRLASREAA